MNIILLSLLSSAVSAGEIQVSKRGHITNPVWSPDGKYIAFEVNEYAGNITLHAVQVNQAQPQGVPKTITLNAGQSSFGGSSNAVTAAPVWHPRGMLFFEGSYKGMSNRIYTTTLTSPPRQAFKENVVGGDLSFPTLSVDGNELYFVSDSSGNGDIYKFSLKNWKEASTVVTSDGAEMSPRVRKDGVLAYSKKTNGSEDLFATSGGASTSRVSGNGDQTRPAWSGNNIVYFSSERGNSTWDVYVADESGAKKRLANNVRLPFRAPPALSTDGEWVAYGVEDPTNANKIWLTRVDGSKTISINTPHVACGEPALTSVDGKTYLAYTALPAEGSDWRKLHVIDVSSSVR